MRKAPPGASQDCCRLKASRRRPGWSKSQVCASAGGCPAWGTWGVTFSPSASSTQLQAGAAPGGIRGTSGPQLGSQVCLAGDAGTGSPQEGCPAPRTPPSTAAQVRGPQLVKLVERGNGSSSNYHHGNYRIAPPTQCVQKRLGESPHDASPASGADSREQALPGLAGLRRCCF